jgi:type I restriction enzyme R subunit
MSYGYSEDNFVELPTIEGLEELGWEVQTAYNKQGLGPDSILGRADEGEVILTRYLLQALKKTQSRATS